MSIITFLKPFKYKNYVGEKYNVSSFKVQNDEEPIPIYGIDKDSKFISLKDSKGEKYSLIKSY